MQFETHSALGNKLCKLFIFLFLAVDNKIKNTERFYSQLPAFDCIQRISLK